MKKLILTIMLTLTYTQSAYAYGFCGIPPIPPIGCSTANATCVCDASGNCYWIFIGCV